MYTDDGDAHKLSWKRSFKHVTRKAMIYQSKQNRILLKSAESIPGTGTRRRMNCHHTTNVDMAHVRQGRLQVYHPSPEVCHGAD
jgi:hypothetical protein